MCKKKAFTLVELLVVIAIIALLMGILMPALSKARSLARRVTCGSRMHNLGLTIENFKSNNDGYYPGAWWGSNSFNRRLYHESLIMAGEIDGEETVKDNDEWVVSNSSVREAYSCPSFRKFLQVCRGSIYGWSEYVEEYYPIGYAYNSHLSQYNMWDNAQNRPTSSTGWSFIGKNVRPNTLVLIDSSSFFQDNGPGSGFYPVYDIQSRYVNMNGTIAGAHSGGFANSLWADMHVEARKANEYSERDIDDPSTLKGKCVLDHKKHKYKDNGYSYSDNGDIACAE